MTVVVGGSSPQITFADSTVQNTAALPLTGGSVSADITVHGLTVGLGGGSVSGNTAIGYQAINSNTGANPLTAVGYQALYNSGSGSGYTVGFGYQAGYSNTSGSSNTFIGTSAGYSNTTASYNTAVGYQAGFTSNHTADANGYNSLFGYATGYSLTTGNSNCLIGTSAGYSLTTGTNNTFVGANTGSGTCGYYVTTGSKNTILGGFNGNQNGLDIRTASNYIVLSDGDGTPRLSFRNGAQCFIGDANGSIRMPSDGGTIYIASVTSNSQFQISYNSVSAGVALTSGGTSWSSFSDVRLKNVTGSYQNALSDIQKIEPIKFTWKNDPNNTPCVGVTAQSVQNIVPEAMSSTTYEMNGDTEYLQVRYTELIPLMIASIQELNTLVTAQATEIATLKAKVGI